MISAAQMKLELKLANLHTEFQVVMMTDKHLMSTIACDCEGCHIKLKLMFNQLFDEYSLITPKISFFCLN